MNPLTPAPPFTERHQFLARFARPGGYTEPVQIALEYSTVTPGEITGVILGGPAAQSVLWEVTRSPYLSFFSEPLPTRPGHSLEVRSERAVFQTIQMVDTATEGLIRRAADLQAYELTVTETRPEGRNLARAVAFYLYGPTSVWDLKPDVEAWMQGRKEHTNADLNLSVEPFQMAVEVGTYQKADPADPQVRLERSVYMLTVLTEAPVEELDDEAFLAAAHQLADDVLLLVSLASKTWVDWFRYALHSGRRTVHHIRHTARSPESGFRGYDRMIVHPPNLRDFLRTALPHYREAREDLYLPILTHIGAKDLHYADAQFLTQFTVLEALRARFARREKAEFILGKKQAQRVRRALREALRSLDLPESDYEAVNAKLPELNRHALAPILESLLASLDVQLAELYPPGVRPSLVSTRNHLVHGDVSSIESDEFFREASRLGILLDRILLRSLGWRDLSAAPSKLDLDYVRKPAASSSQ